MESTNAFFARLSGRWDAIPAHDIDSRRETLAELTREITEAFRQAGISEAYLEPLQELNRALFDLGNGVRNPLFKIQSGGREPGNSYARQRRVYASALVQWLAPLPVKDAHALVAKEFTKAGHKGYNGKSITINTVRKWCEEVREGGDREGERRLAELKVAQWREKQAGLIEPTRPATFVRHIAAGLLEKAH